MRGVFFKQSLEYRLEITGDEWHQGDTVCGTLVIINHGTTSVPLSGTYIQLCQGTTKKVQAKAEDAFQTITAAEVSLPIEVLGEGQVSVSWSFALDRNCLITDKTQSLYVICGKNDLLGMVGNLQINVLPHLHIEAALMLLENSFSFVLKGSKSTKGWVEAKLKPPTGISFPTLEQLLILLRFEDDTLHVKYRFKLKVLAATSTTLDVKKGQREIEQQIPCRDYLFSGGLINHDPLEKHLEEALAVVRGKI